MMLVKAIGGGTTTESVVVVVDEVRMGLMCNVQGGVEGAKRRMN
jgi:hypothetical protein